MEKKLNEDSPEGWTGTVRAMKTKHKGEIDNPYALAHWMKNKGYDAHYEDQESSLEGKPKKKKKHKDEDEDEKDSKKEHKGGFMTFNQWVEYKETNSDCQCSCASCKNGDCSGCTCKDCSCEGCNC